MRSDRLTRRLLATAGAAAILTMVGLSAACAREEAKAPEKTVTETVTVTAPAPTEKAPRIGPGPNPFTPPVTPAPQMPPTHVPGQPGGH
jgi:hypothetical protein